MIPAYNERATIEELLKRVQAVALVKELVVIDDGFADDTREVLPAYEVPIAYDGRTYDEGKKITWRDGVRAVWCRLRYGLGG